MGETLPLKNRTYFCENATKRQKKPLFQFLLFSDKIYDSMSPGHFVTCNTTR